MATDTPKCLFDNRLDDGTPAASSTAAGYSVLSLREWRPYTAWQPTSLPATVTVDCAAPAPVDYWAIYEHDLHTQGATIQLRGSTDNFAASDVLVDSVTPSSDAPFVRFVASVSYRYWRIRITGTTAPTLAIAALGEAFEIPAYLSSGFDPIGRSVKGQVNRSELGHPLGRTVMYEAWEESVTFECLSWSWLRADWLAAWRAHLRDEPFLWLWDQTGHPDEVYLVAVKDGFKSPHQPGSYTNLNLTLYGVVT